MDPANFTCLLVLLREKLVRHSKRKAIAPEIRLSLTLLYLAQGVNMQMLAWTHKLGASTVRKIVYETCDAIWSELHGIYLSPPNILGDWQRNARSFFIRSGMPNCLGAIDGKHVNVVRPINSGSLYFNYKKNISIILMAACKANYCFSYVDIGALGTQSNEGVFMRSRFGREILNGTQQVPLDCHLPASSVTFSYYFVADSAFPLMPNIMRPYPGQQLPADKRFFNEALSRARVVIENTFGILSSRWRVLRSLIHAKPENADKIVLATTVLHNFMMLKRDTNYFNENELDMFGDGVVLRSARLPTANRSASYAFSLRDKLKDFLFDAPSV